MMSLAVCAACALPATACAERAATGDARPLIPYERFVLPNGLRVLVHTDRSAPLISVSVWYHVGSKDEGAGLEGFAHLYEHLMFNGSEHADTEFMVPLQRAGATGINGTTTLDRTNYFETVPKTALESVLWLESDRMGHLLGAVTQEKLDNQRSVVLNEKRRAELVPYGQTERLLHEGLFPPGHPYRWTTVGSEKDLNSATLENVKDWFRRHYGAANAVLVLAGDMMRLKRVRSSRSISERCRAARRERACHAGFRAEASRCGLFRTIASPPHASRARGQRLPLAMKKCLTWISSRGFLAAGAAHGSIVSLLLMHSLPPRSTYRT